MVIAHELDLKLEVIDAAPAMSRSLPPHQSAGQNSRAGAG